MKTKRGIMKPRLMLLFVFVFVCICFADYEIVATIDAPDTNISGLGFGNGSLWAIDGVTEFAYEIDPTSGSVENSWYCDNGTKKPSGLTFSNSKIYIIMGVTPNFTGSYCYTYNTSGDYQSQFSLDC